MKIDLVLILAACLMLNGCQEEIYLNLNDADPRIVIEAEVIDSFLPHSVRLSHTINFSQSNIFAGIPNAVVVLSDDNGLITQLDEDSTGFYSTRAFQAEAGRTYSLSVTTNEKTFTSSYKMPLPTDIDSIRVVPYIYGLFEYKTVEVYFADRINEDNYYRLKLFVNNELFGAALFRDDDQDGKQIVATLMATSSLDEKYKINPGDTIEVELYSITKNMFNYYRSIRNTSSASPANPDVNIAGALGYFNVCSLRGKRIVMQ